MNCLICKEPLGHYFEYVRKTDIHSSCAEKEAIHAQAKAEGAAEEREAILTILKHEAEATSPGENIEQWNECASWLFEHIQARGGKP